MRLDEGKIVPAVLLPHEAKQAIALWHLQNPTSVAVDCIALNY